MAAISSKMHNKAIVRISKAAFVPHSAFETAHRWRWVLKSILDIVPTCDIIPS